MATVQRLEHLFYDKRLGEMEFFGLEKRRLMRDLINMCIYICVYIHEARVKRQWTALFSSAQCQEQRQWTQNGTWEVPSEHQETFVCHVDDQTLSQSAQKLRSFLFRDFQKPPKHELGHPALTGPSGAEDQIVWEGPAILSRAVILRFTETVILRLRECFGLLQLANKEFFFPREIYSIWAIILAIHSNLWA